MKDIKKYSEKVLSEPAKEVQIFDRNLIDLVDEMTKIMKEKEGVGLAAPQVGVPLRVAVVDVSPAGYNGKAVLINPKIISHSKKYSLLEEGCLSIPGLYLPIPRFLSASIEYSDFENRKHIINANGYFAKAIQHEIDHLDGILFVERFREFFEIEKIEDEEMKKILTEILSVLDRIKSESKMKVQ